MTRPRKRYTWSLENAGNRAALSVVIGWLAWLATLRITGWIFVLVTVVSYALMAAIIKRRD